MRVRVLGSAPEDASRKQYLSSYLVNDSVAVDAGCLGQHRTPTEQAAIRHIFLTHSHLDHTGSLPVFVENVYGLQGECPVIYGPAHTIQSLQQDIFNDGPWPDFVRIGATGLPFMRLVEVAAEIPIEADGLWVTPVAVDHVVPTFAYVVSSPDASVIFAADSGPTDRLWEVARQTPHLRGVFLECSFPNERQWLADVSLHLTPNTFAQETAKLAKGVQVIAVHIKPRFREAIVSELSKLEIPGLTIAECETTYSFSGALASGA